MLGEGIEFRMNGLESHVAYQKGLIKGFGHIVRKENERTAKRLYVGENVRSRSVG